MIKDYILDKKSLALGFVFLFLNAYGFAAGRISQNHNVTEKVFLDSLKGTVVDNNGKPLKNVKISNTSSGVTIFSSINGYFALPGKIGDKLKFEHPDFYILEKIYTGDKRSLWVQLAGRYLPSKDIVGIDANDSLAVDRASVEVLHARQLKENLLQSVASVNTNQLTTTPASQFLQALPGRIAGLNIGFTSGGPGLDGNGLNYNVRSALGNNIILIDGVQRPYISIDPDQIESVSVYKDALATVMFGMRSSNGIIAITTKKGDKGAPRISFSAQGGIERPIVLPKSLDAATYAMLYNEAKQNDAPAGVTLTPSYSAADIALYQNQTDPFRHPNVDWYNTVLRKQSYINRYNFNVQGSGKGFRYFVDLDNLRETGLFNTNDSLNSYNTNAQLDRYIVRSNLGVDLTKTTVMQLNLFGRIAKNNQPGGTTATVFSSLAATPNNAYPIFNPNGTLGGTSTYGQNANLYGQILQRGYQFQDARDVSVDLQLTQRLDAFLPGLYAKIQGSYNNSTLYKTDRSKNFASFQLNPNNSYTAVGTITEQGTVGTPGVRSRVIYTEADLGYEHSFEKHNLSALVLRNEQSTMQFDTGTLPEIYTDYAARFQYNYDQKYLFEAAGSYAGYNWFAPANRWEPYWALGMGWNIHHEEFIKRNLKWVSNFKIRGTYGLTGQANAGYYTYIQTYWTPATNTNNGDGYYFGNTGVGVTRSTGENSLANPDLAAEKAKKTNIALDLGFWNNKLTLTAEYFNNRFYDLVGAVGSRTNILGAAYPNKNLYIYNYKGSDISLTYQDNISNFNFFVSGNLSLVQSKVIYMDEIARNYDYQRQTDKPVGTLYGYTAMGLFQSLAEINDPATAVLAATPKSSLRPGDIRYMDRNGDGIINELDKGPIGSEKPTVYYGATIGFNFKGFDFSALLQGVMNRQTALGGPTGQYGDFYNGFGNGGTANAFEFNLGRWTPATAATASQPRLWLGANANNQEVSSYWLQNTSFVRLKNVEIGYTIPAYLTKKIGVASIRLFSNGLNLFTWSPLSKFRKDVDPESLNPTYPMLKVFNFGINAKF